MPTPTPWAWQATYLLANSVIERLADWMDPKPATPRQRPAPDLDKLPMPPSQRRR